MQQPHFGQAKAAVFAGLGSSVAAAVVRIALHRLKEVDVRAIVFHYSIVIVVAAIGAIFLFDPGTLPSPDLSTRTISLLLGLGLAAESGQYFVTKSLANGLPARVSVVGLTQVAFALAFKVMIWQRSFSALSLVGIVLVLAPTGWILWNRPNANS